VSLLIRVVGKVKSGPSEGLYNPLSCGQLGRNKGDVNNSSKSLKIRWIVNHPELDSKGMKSIILNSFIYLIVYKKYRFVIELFYINEFPCGIIVICLQLRADIYFVVFITQLFICNVNA